MPVMETSRLLEHLEARTQQDWLRALDELEPAIHPVDRTAARIWFAFWPLELKESLSSPEGVEEMARVMDLEGAWKLDEHVDDSIGFLYGARHWRAVKQAVLSQIRKAEPTAETPLARTIHAVASLAADTDKVDSSLVLGAAAAALMILRQVGLEAFEKAADSPATGPLLPGSPDRIVAARTRTSRDGLFTFLKGVNRNWEVRWDERRSDGTFHARNGQDLAMAAADKGDYRSVDYRRIEGPLPVECRIGSCGYCWVGVLAGKDKLSEISDYERERLRYFGYDTINDESDPHPLIRLGCQAQCRGDVTLAISPWNGELNRRHNEGPKKLGTS